MRWWRRLAAQVPSCKAILDIGAFQGEYALAAREVNPSAGVYAFEPNPHLLANLWVVCDQRAVALIDAVVAEEDGELRFVCCSAQSRIVENATSADANRELLWVRALTLDSWVRANSIEPVLIKMDVEGAEPGILRQARKVLDEYHPVILCEVLSDVAGAEVMNALPDYYRFYRVDENRGVFEESRITRRRWRDKNWLLIPEEKQAAVMGLQTIDHP